MELAPAVFVDRDGTLNEMVYDVTHGLLDSPRRPEQVVGMPFAKEFLCGLHQLGFKIVVVTNQPGISKGTLTLGELDSINQKLAEILSPGRWDLLAFCPHHPDFSGTCDCRKPKAGMLLKAAAEKHIDLARSWMIGDGLTDIQAGAMAGCRTILLTKLKLDVVEKFFELKDSTPDFIASTLKEALAHIDGNSRELVSKGT